MKKTTSISLIFIALLLLLSGPLILPAQVTFVQPDPDNSLGITATAGLMGCAWGDYDDDGDLDLFVPCGNDPSVLYRNDVNESGQFTKVSKDAETDEGILYDPAGNSQGIIWGDFDNDGDLDLFMTNSGLALFRNDGSVFTDISEAAGLTTIEADQVLWQITAGDYDKDGDLDIAFAGSDQGAGGAALPTHILNNDNCVFTDVKDNVIGFDLNLESWCPYWLDVDNDDDLDLWMSTLRTPNEPCALLLNEQGELNYASSDQTGITAKSAITSGWGDFDNDCDLDLIVIPYSNDTDGNCKLFRNNGGSTFTNIAPGTVLDLDFADARGVCWGDYDNDGHLDLWIARRSGGQSIFHNNGDGTFTDTGAAIGLDVMTGRDPRSVVFVDYDNDGFLDAFGKGQNSLPWLFHNEGNTNHWIVIKPRGNGVTNNTAGIGARVKVVAGSLTQFRYIEGSGSGCASGHLWAHFGLGTATTVDSVIVIWPSGTKEFSINVAADSCYFFTEGRGITAIDQKSDKTILKSFALHQNYPNPFNPVTTISFNLPVRSQVRLSLVNMLGQEIKVLTHAICEAGHYQIQLDGSALAAGIYFYKLETPNFSAVRKLVLLK